MYSLSHTRIHLCNNKCSLADFKNPLQVFCRFNVMMKTKLTDLKHGNTCWQALRRLRAILTDSLLHLFFVSAIGHG